MNPQLCAQVASDLFWLALLGGICIGIALTHFIKWMCWRIERRVYERDTFRDLVAEARVYAARLNEARQTELRG